MRYILTTFLLASIVGVYGQSKKEVIKENDSLKQVIIELQKQNGNLTAEVSAIKVELDLKISSNDTAQYLYTFGVLVGDQLSNKKFGAVDLSPLNRGFYDGYHGKAPKTVIEYSNDYKAAEQKMAEAEKAKSQAAGQAFLAENATKEGVHQLPSGLQYKVITEGKGEKPNAKSTVKVHYTGKTLDGKVFDSSVQRGQPTTFPLNGVIKGWTEGVALMTPGSKYIFYIPSDLAYGARGAGADIPPYATLVFEVELIEVVEYNDSHDHHDHSDPNHKH
ncbi:FKBP-type peptidyl-prolyl cis-trans isomerase [Cyclobacteriaceae bacterium]|nr:FKBP-type peptidyl-prolyl cis-trans isomerase [Cyclobacteriaceae bacterium]